MSKTFKLDTEKFGAFVARLRKEKGMTQKDLAERLYVSDKAVSKWERGLSLPDITLLQPMADIFSVTVSELLAGEYAAGPEPDAGQAEELARGVLDAFSERENRAAQGKKRRLRKFYFIALAVGLAELALLARRLRDELFVFMILPPGLAAAFGVYLCFFAKDSLPLIYDKANLSFYADGLFSMSFPGVRFNNNNWPRILLSLRGWCLAVMTLWMPTYALVHQAVPVSPGGNWMVQMAVELPVFFVIFFGSLFGPVCYTARKYE